MGDHLNIFLEDHQINHVYRKQLLFQHLLNILASLTLTTIIISNLPSSI